MAKLIPLPTRETLVRRMLRYYDQADAATLEKGRNWYPDAKRFCEELASESETYSADTVAAVVAVLSPRVNWASNMSDAKDMVMTAVDPEAGEYPPLRAIGDNISKAAFILNGEAPENVLSGPKVIPFRDAIMGDENAFVCDSWMMRVFGIDRDAPTPRVLKEIRAAAKLAAKRRNESVRSMQAIAWIVIRGSAS